jgi:hypothetical protein
MDLVLEKGFNDFATDARDTLKKLPSETESPQGLGNP